MAPGTTSRDKKPMDQWLASEQVEAYMNMLNKKGEYKKTPLECKKDCKKQFTKLYYEIGPPDAPKIYPMALPGCSPTSWESFNAKARECYLWIKRWAQRISTDPRNAHYWTSLIIALGAIVSPILDAVASFYLGRLESLKDIVLHTSLWIATKTFVTSGTYSLTEKDLEQWDQLSTDFKYWAIDSLENHICESLAKELSSGDSGNTPARVRDLAYTSSSAAGAQGSTINRQTFSSPPSPDDIKRPTSAYPRVY
ncbi:hypothetical protein MGYG_03590 [Nannizzia gypsea CBS 118893]|uniref:Uncharacterized protein n=1 Tax=Arthroderma gypseum (strain ATCC MYA-4604 / CBS 118893) TaxID=535722 RepID=E4USS0_ARTGP|nr:hypothetical protein MGYG_03590 [Nannizzia gypsea CBS 118893]EFR00585.1 hypothetical protein MGYG_03590 [Nannizzia gypsea CBS 118893]